MNECHFLGNLTRDPELKIVAGDKKVVSFGIAVNRRYKRGKETVQEASFLDMEAWDTGAEMIDKHFKKGDPIIVHASVKQDSWDDKTTGQKRTKLKFRVNKFEFVPGKKNRDDQDDQRPEPTPAAAGDVGNDDDIPF